MNDELNESGHRVLAIVGVGIAIIAIITVVCTAAAPLVAELQERGVWADQPAWAAICGIAAVVVGLVVAVFVFAIAPCMLSSQIGRREEEERGLEQ